ncbi:MAG: type II toxin-antitoxin system HicA family toxin [Sarcina sp.]
MVKKKATETLSKKEKAFLSNARESLKKDIERDEEIYRNYYEEEILEYIEYESVILMQFTEDFITEANKVLQINKFKNSGQLQDFTNIYQLLIGLKQEVINETDDLFMELEESILDAAHNNVKEIMKDISRGYEDRKRVLDIFETEFRKKKINLVKRIINEARQSLDDNLKDSLIKIDEILKMANESLIQINEHLNNIDKEDKDVISVELKPLDKTSIGYLNGNEVECNHLGFYMQRRVMESATIDEIKRSEERLKQTMSGNSIIKNDIIRLEDGKTLTWNGDGFKIDASTITDKAYSYKELNSLAEELGYRLDRCKGDHGVFIQEGKENVIIPQGREIGKGLQLKILKDLNVI